MRERGVSGMTSGSGLCAGVGLEGGHIMSLVLDDASVK